MVVPHNSRRVSYGAIRRNHDNLEEEAGDNFNILGEKVINIKILALI